MEVFNPSQVKSESEKRLAKDALRAQNLMETTKEILQEKDAAERSFREMMDSQRKESEEWLDQSNARKNELLEEVKELEKRRKEALMPLYVKEEDIHSIQEHLHAQTLILEAQKNEFEDESRLLMRRLDEVASKEQVLDELKVRLLNMEKGAELQKNQVAESARRLGVQLNEFEMNSRKREEDFAFRESELDARKNLYDEKDRLLGDREREIESAKRLLADQRLLLEKGFEELRRTKKQYVTK